jgi:pyruvate/2-oxoglutarate dehydrogenase complex dihydrolipoamide acyltransferase (E2) component
MLAVSVLVASFGADDVKSQTFVGRLPVADGQARVAVVLTGQEFVAYACGNRTAFAKDYQRWWKGTLADGAAHAEIGGVKLELVRTTDGLAGELRGADGAALAFSASLAPRGTLAGLYRGEQTVGGQDYVLGWIVDAKHQVVGGCSCKGSGAKKPLAAVRRLPPATGKRVALKPRVKEAKPAEEEPAPKTDDSAPQEDEGVEAQPDPGDALDAAAEDSAETGVRPAKVKSAGKLPKGAVVKKPVKKQVEPVDDEEPAEEEKPAPKKKPAAKPADDAADGDSI